MVWVCVSVWLCMPSAVDRTMAKSWVILLLNLLMALFLNQTVALCSRISMAHLGVIWKWIQKDMCNGRIHHYNMLCVLFRDFWLVTTTTTCPKTMVWKVNVKLFKCIHMLIIHRQIVDSHEHWRVQILVTGVIHRLTFLLFASDFAIGSDQKTGEKQLAK